MLPHRLLLAAALLLAGGAFAGTVCAWGLPPRSLWARGWRALLPQLAATLGALAAVAGWLWSRRLIAAWRNSDIPPAPVMRASLERVIGWSGRWGSWQAVFVLACLTLAAQPFWRGRVADH